MFSSIRLHAFVCIALGIAVSAAPAGAPGAGLDARSPDTYDLSGGLLPLLGFPIGDEGDADSDTYILRRQLAGLDIGSRLGSNMGINHAAMLGEGALGLGSNVGAESAIDARSPDTYDLSGGLLPFFGFPYGNEGDADSDTYILKRQLAGLDIGSRLSSNMGAAHAAGLGEGALGLASSVEADSAVEARSPDVYDLSGDGGIAGYPFGLFGYPYGDNYGGGSDEDVYILKREGSDVAARSPDLYDLSGGLLPFLGYPIGNEGDEDSDTYILKRQVDLASATNLASGANLDSFDSLGLNGNADSTSTSTSADAAGSGFDVNSILSSLFGTNTGVTGDLASSFSLGN